MNGRLTIFNNPLGYIQAAAAVQQGVGAFIAGPEPGNPFGAAIQRGYRRACDSWSNGPNWVTGLTPQGRAAFSNFCGPYLAGNGSGDPVNSQPPPPFTGGQCAGVSYNFNLIVTFGGGPISIPKTANGPIGLIKEPSPSGSTFEGGYSYGGGEERIVTGATNIAIGSVVRADGLPDSCGNPPAPPPTVGPNPNPRPDPGLDPTDTPFSDPSGRPIVPMPKIPDPFGDPVQMPNLPFPDIFGDGDAPAGPPAGPGSPGSPLDTGLGDDAIGSAPSGSVLIGVKVSVIESPPFARVAQFIPDPPFIGAGYVYLGWPNQLELQAQGTFLLDGDFFVAPVGSTRWRVRATVGYNLRVTPYYAQSDPQEV